MDLLPSPTIALSSFRASTFIIHSPIESDLYDTLEDAVACIVFSSSNSPLGPEPVILYFSTTSFLLDSIPRELAKIDSLTLLLIDNENCPVRSSVFSVTLSLGEFSQDTNTIDSERINVNNRINVFFIISPPLLTMIATPLTFCKVYSPLFYLVSSQKNLNCSN